jgi:hypothetical protein
LLVVLPTAPRADEPPVVFARSGQKTILRLASYHNLPGGSTTLRAYGQIWGEAATVENGIAHFVAPTVRVPTVFRVVPVSNNKIALAELVVYPEGWIPWDTDKQLSKYKETQFVAAGAPDWLNRWFSAVGFPIEKLPGRESLERGNWRMLEKPALLILGRETAGRGPAAVGRLAIDHRANVLVIEADWLDKSKTVAANVVVAPKHARGQLADLQSQQWPSPPCFGRQAVPWPVVWNRLVWLDGAEYPLVEEVYSRQKGAEALRIAFNYLPWQEQLGRCEMADELFLRILATTAKGANHRAVLNRRWCLLYPAMEKIKVEERPVLFAALESAAAKVGSDGAIVLAAESPEICGYVLDLRGGSPLPDDLFADSGMVKNIATRINAHTPLLILGDNRQLDNWEWLELDREHRKSPRPGVCWIPDNSLPPSLEAQLRVMEVLTQWGVFLGDTSREKSYENRENEL